MNELEIKQALVALVAGAALLLLLFASLGQHADRAGQLTTPAPAGQLDYSTTICVGIFRSCDH